MQGRSFLQLAEGHALSDWRKDWLYEYYEYPGYENVKPHRGVRTERYKYIHYFTEPQEYELYDLKADPNEDHNLYGRPGQEALTAKLRDRLEALRKETGDDLRLQADPRGAHELHHRAARAADAARRLAGHAEAMSDDYAECERQAEAAYDAMYDARRPKDAYEDAIDAFRRAIKAAEAAGEMGEAKRLEARRDHVREVYRKQFRSW